MLAVLGVGTAFPRTALGRDGGGLENTLHHTKVRTLTTSEHAPSGRGEIGSIKGGTGSAQHPATASGHGDSTRGRVTIQISERLKNGGEFINIEGGFNRDAL